MTGYLDLAKRALLEERWGTSVTTEGAACPRPSDHVMDLPEGWQEAVDLWVRLGCPKGDPVMIGLNMLALRHLSQMPQKQRPRLLKAWRQQIRERVNNSQ